VGADRIVNAIAVQHLHGSPAIVVDLDTATSFDIVAPDGSYAGSVIAPGLALSAEALAQHTSRLQGVRLGKPSTVVGKDTIGALQAGLIYGHVALIEGLVERIRSEIEQPDAVVVATGELAPYWRAKRSASTGSSRGCRCSGCGSSTSGTRRPGRWAAIHTYRGIRKQHYGSIERSEIGTEGGLRPRAKPRILADGLQLQPGIPYPRSGGSGGNPHPRACSAWTGPERPCPRQADAQDKHAWAGCHQHSQ